MAAQRKISTKNGRAAKNFKNQAKTGNLWKIW